VQLTRDGGSSTTTTIQAGQPSSFTFDVVTGTYRITVTPVDRRGLGKAGRPAEKTVLVLAGSSPGLSKTDPAENR
jgi:hypothetical protein